MAGVSELENRLTVEETGDTAISNVSLPVRLPRSAAETVTLSVPRSADVGVPLKVRFNALNASHAGRVEPPAVAV